MRLSAGLLLMALTITPIPASAHAQLDKAIPLVGGTVATSPPEVRIVFTQPLDPQKSGIEVTTADGRSVTATRATVDGAQMVLKLPRLPDGKYSVSWHTLSTDGGDHALTGHYTFEIRH
jgi:methionine-rich copper-binding protein CopC